MRILYSAPLYDASGYSNFARNFVFSLHKIGAKVRTNPMKLGEAFPNLTTAESLLLKQLKSKKTHKFNVNVMNTLPTEYPNIMREDCANVGFTMFETSRVPKAWVDECNKTDAILVPSSWNSEVFKKSGVTVPIYVVPPGIKEAQTEGATINLPMLKNPEKVYKFYSVFEWTERKNPIGLIKSYLATFTGIKDVALFLKVYSGEDTPEKRQWLAQQIKEVMNLMRLDHYPHVILIPEILSTEHMGFFHRTCDCFVLPTRAEGIGLPTMEAMSYGKPVITTKYGGSLQVCNENNSFLIDNQETFVCNMPWIDCYEGNMTWAEPNLVHLGQLMKNCYQNPSFAKMVGQIGRKHILTKFNPEARAKHLLTVLEEIHENKIHSKQKLPKRKARRTANS